mmetsp:Transcript_6560/g.16095  ORF Transcript_6560/g.16095 Transcript_6560/m.16095 type:complete len:367 (+) Transcript_6560:46-1146(+)
MAAARLEFAKSHDDGRVLVALCITYCGLVVVLVLAYAVVLRTCVEPLLRVSAKISSLLARKHLELQAPLDIACLGFLATPAFVFAICLVLGPFVAFAESWSASLGIEYMLGNLMGLTQPLTDDVPQSAVGIILAVVISAVGLLLVTLCLGIGQSLVSACRVWELSSSISSFFLWVFGVNLAMMALLSFVIGSLLSAVEGWTLLDGCKFAVAQICQFPNSLTEVAPVTGWGIFIEVLCISLQVLVQSVALDTISTHPVTGNFIDRIKKKGVRMRASQRTGDAEGSLAREDGGMEGSWRQQVLATEKMLKELELREAEHKQKAEALQAENAQYREKVEGLELETKALRAENLQLRNEVALKGVHPLAL